MHILVTNDDGPPSPTSSPYVHNLVRELQKAGHTVSVCLPHGQRSWIGKAHMIGQTVKPLYYRPSATFDPTPAAAGKVQGTTHPRPSQKPQDEIEEWILVDGTPASAAQIGLHHHRHFFGGEDRGPVDLVVSGPNYGRNTTAVFALSSGTLGGALEAAVCRRRAVALSYAHSTKNHNHDPVVIAAATRHAVRVVEALYAQWPADGSVDVYTVNVPLVEGVGDGGHKTLFAPMLQNYWGTSGGEGNDASCFQEIEVEEDDDDEAGDDGDEAEEKIREGETGSSNGTKKQQKAKVAHRHFKWAPQFKDVHRSVEESPPGNDGWCVKEGHTSITPLKANFWHSATDLHGSELKLPEFSSSNPEEGKGAMSTLAFRPGAHFFALVAYEDAYVQPLILAALQKLFPPDSYTLLSAPPSSTTAAEISLSKLLPDSDSNGSSPRILQITPYEAIDWDFAEAHPRTCLVNSYMLRKALIRKHYLAATVAHWTSKRPASALRRHVVQHSEAFELDYAEFLDDALVEAFDLRASLERNAAKLESGGDGGGGNDNDNEDEDDLEWWILKPSMSDRGQGIRLFCTMDELQAIFDEWEEDQPESDDDDDEDGYGSEGDGNAATRDDGERDYITASHLRHFVAQPYIHPPLLLPGDGRKFHIRTYVACIGSLDVYVYRQMLALFAGRPYTAPKRSSTSNSATAIDTAATNSAAGLESHLTNTCLQRSVAEGTVRRFWDLDLEAGRKEQVFAQICDVAGELFEAAARGMLMHFRPLPNAFELYGVDFLVDAAGRPWLLEVNAFPDFRQTGDDLKDLVAGLWEAVLERAVSPFFFGGGADGDHRDGDEDGLVHVRHVDLLGNQ